MCISIEEVNAKKCMCMEIEHVYIRVYIGKQFILIECEVKCGIGKQENTIYLHRSSLAQPPRSLPSLKIGLGLYI